MWSWIPKLFNHTVIILRLITYLFITYVLLGNPELPLWSLPVTYSDLRAQTPGLPFSYLTDFWLVVWRMQVFTLMTAHTVMRPGLSIPGFLHNVVVQMAANQGQHSCSMYILIYIKNNQVFTNRKIINEDKFNTLKVKTRLFNTEHTKIFFFY